MKKILTVILLILAIILGGTWGLVASYADTVEIDDPAVKFNVFVTMVFWY